MPWTDKPASPAESFPRIETKQVELSGGQVVRVKAIPALALGGFANLEELRDKDAGDPRVLEMYRRMAQLGVVSPRFDFSGDPDAPGAQWDALPPVDQGEIIKLINELTTRGVSEVAAKEAEFPGGDGGGDAARPASAGPGEGVRTGGDTAAPAPGY